MPSNWLDGPPRMESCRKLPENTKRLLGTLNPPATVPAAPADVS